MKSFLWGKKGALLSQLEVKKEKTLFLQKGEPALSGSKMEL